MKYKFSTSQRLFSALGMLCLATISKADLIRFSATTSTSQFGTWPYVTGFDETVTLPKFNPMYGMLDGITLTLDAVGTTSGWGFGVYNPFTFAVDAYPDVSGNLILSRPDGSELVFMGHFSSIGKVHAVLPPGITTSVFVSVPDSTDTVLLANLGDLSLFTGEDSITLPVQGGSGPYVYPNTLTIVSATPQIGFGRVTATYDFTPVAEPSSFALLSLGITSVALPFQRRIGNFIGWTALGSQAIVGRPESGRREGNPPASHTT
jgi:hypothetical protein